MEHARSTVGVTTGRRGRRPPNGSCSRCLRAFQPPAQGPAEPLKIFSDVLNVRVCGVWSVACECSRHFRDLRYPFGIVRGEVGPISSRLFRGYGRAPSDAWTPAERHAGAQCSRHGATIVARVGGRPADGIARHRKRTVGSHKGRRARRWSAARMIDHMRVFRSGGRPAR